MRTATELLAELLAIYEDPEQVLHFWMHHHRSEIREVIEGEDPDIECAQWAVSRGLAKLRTTDFNTCAVEFKDYSQGHATLLGAIESMAIYARRYGAGQAREGEEDENSSHGE